MAEGVGVPDEQLDEWERLANEATPGPWSAANEHGLIKGADPAWCVSRMRPGYEAMSPTEGYLYDIAYTTGTNEEPDADFIAAAREALPALVGEVRASHAREAELLRDNLVIDKATFTRTHPDSHLGHAPSIAYSELEAERDVLQQRIDKALELHQEVSRPAYGGQITDAAGNPVPFTPPYSVSCSCGKPYCTVRAALTGTGDTE